MEDSKKDSAISSISDSIEESPVITVDRYGVPSLSSSMKYVANIGDNSELGITLAWKEISVHVPVKKTGFQRQEKHRHFKRVLNNVTGIVYPGSLTAVMGASGAGKTTLMNVLAHKAKGDVEIGGEILVNGTAVGPSIGDISGYVYQEDLFIGTLTVSEHLYFMASIKLDQRLKRSERIRRVEELLIDLSLKKCENTRIGVPGQQSGISGGERKRLAFATEIITNPSLLFCDEPTTGLDSFSAKKIVGMLKKMASQGKTILCTIHQPSSQIFAMFDQFCLLAEGCTAFMGSSDGAITFLNKLNYHCPPHYNLGDFYIRTLSVIPGKELESRMNIKHICYAFSKSEEAENIDENVQNEIKKNFAVISNGVPVKVGDWNLGLRHGQKRPKNWFSLTNWLIWRAMLNIKRNPKIQAVRTVQKIVQALLIGICYFGISFNQEGIQNVQGLIYLLVIECSFPSIYGALHVFPLQFPVFLREEKAGLYRVSSFYVANIISIIPSLTLQGLLFATIAYYLVGLQPNFTIFLSTCLFIILIINIGSALGCFFSALFDSVSTASICLIPFDFILMVTGGQYMNLGTLPVYIVWAKYLSWFMYSNEAISTLQWRGVSNITCDISTPVPCMITGEEVLQSRNFHENPLTFDFIGLVTLYILFHVGGYLSLSAKCRKK